MVAEKKIYCYSNGSIYIRKMKKDVPDGLGTMHLKNGSIITGEWSQGSIKQTEQIKQFKNGVLFIGRKTNNQFHGITKACFKGVQQQLAIQFNTNQYKILVNMEQKKKNGMEVKQGDLTTGGNISSQTKVGLKNSFAQQIKGKNWKFKKLQDIGKGGFGSIAKQKAAHPEFKGVKKIFAIKWIENSQSSQIEKTIFFQIHKIPHKNLIKLEEFIKLDNKNLYFVMEYCEGTLSQVPLSLFKGKTPQILFHMFQLCNAIQHMHKNIGQHRDINIKIQQINQYQGYIEPKTIYKKARGICIQLCTTSVGPAESKNLSIFL